MRALALLWCFLAGLACAQVPEAAETYRRDLIRAARNVWGLNAPVATFAAQIEQESRFKPAAKSSVGAIGLAQFMPATAQWISGAFPAELGAGDPMNPTWAMLALSRYDKWLWDRIKADDACERMAFVLASYNGGLAWVFRRQARSATPGLCFEATCKINPGIHPLSQIENERYPVRILKVNEPKYRNDRWGIGSCSPG